MQIAHLSKIERGDRLATREQAAALAQYYGLDALVVEAKRRAEEILREYGYEPATWAAVGLLEEEASHYRSDAVYVNNDAQPKQMLLLR
jgi:transcriptional regulator with XRE-family HTH domain